MRVGVGVVGVTDVCAAFMVICTRLVCFVLGTGGDRVWGVPHGAPAVKLCSLSAERHTEYCQRRASVLSLATATEDGGLDSRALPLPASSRYASARRPSESSDHFFPHQGDSLATRRRAVVARVRLLGSSGWAAYQAEVSARSTQRAALC